MNMNPQCVREEGRRGKNPKLNPTSDPKTQDEKKSQSTTEEPVYTARKSVAPLKPVNSETRKSTGDLILNAAIRAVADADSGMTDNQRTGEVYQNPTMTSRSWQGGNNPEITCKEYEVLIKLVNLYNQLEHPHPTDLDEIGRGQLSKKEPELVTFVLETHNPDHLISISTAGTFNLRINAYLISSCQLFLQGNLQINKRSRSNIHNIDN